jgi:RNA polymerase sigma-70 factor, ECF subfamily
MNRSRAAHESRSDVELIRLAQRDSVAFRVLYERHASAMEQWIYAQTYDRTTARELLAETWAAIWLNAPRFRDEDNRAGTQWLYGIAKNLLLQYLHRHRVESKARKQLKMRSVSWDDGELDETPRRLDAEKLSPGVREAFARLTWEQQKLLGLRVVRGRTYEEVANELGISQTTARIRVAHALQMLRRVLKGAML